MSLLSVVTQAVVALVTLRVHVVNKFVYVTRSYNFLFSVTDNQRW